jgi:hypothetical protein
MTTVAEDTRRVEELRLLEAESVHIIREVVAEFALLQAEGFFDRLGDARCGRLALRRAGKVESDSGQDRDCHGPECRAHEVAPEPEQAKVVVLVGRM